MALFPKIPNPFCVWLGHQFVTQNGKVFCSYCGKKVK